jgi:hypothetical protein
VIDRLRALLGPFGLPPDYVAWSALAVGVVLLAGAFLGGPIAGWIEPTRRPAGRVRFVLMASFAAAFLSLGYIAFYLRGGPRIIDATAYFLEGRTIAHGSFTFDVIDPTASFRGRFLLLSAPHRLGAIFPPGYPLLLAFGFVIGAPMVIGPLLAAALTAATYFFARALGEAALGAGRSREVERAARGAALLSVMCAALRYHTADTMSHGAAALALTLAATALLRAWRAEELDPEPRRGAYSLLGFAVGGLIATRPVSALPIAALAVVAVLRARPRRLRRFARVAVFAAPGIVLLLASQHAVAGSWFSSTQKAYYALSDGPPDCFRYGFGPGIGCMFEHGDFVRSRLGPEGTFGVLAVLGTTLRRLRLHLADVTNFELVTLALLIPAIALVRRSTEAKLVAILVAGQVLVYAPFYFDGSYPGGGARFYADVIPLEHALFVVALAARFARVARPLSIALGAGAAGFAFHGAHDLVALANRDGGRPMFEPDLVRESHKDHGLLFFDTDHGFDLALDPGVTASHGILAVRRRNDDRDRFLYEMLGHPSTHRYVFGPDKSTMEPWIPPSSGPNVYRFESEAEWPPLSQAGGWVEPAWANGTASNDRYLRIIPSAPRGRAIESAVADAELELLVPANGRYSLEPTSLVQGLGSKATMAVVSRGAVVASWDWSDPKVEGARARAVPLAPKTAQLASPARLRLRVTGGPAGLDRIIIRKLP